MSSLRPLSILLIEDHRDTARATVRLLRSSGYEVEHADGCEAARAAVKSKTYDLILCDLGLPDGDAYELFAEIKKAYEVEGIVYSGNGSMDDVQRSKDAGFIRHLVKPIPYPELVCAIAQATPPR